MGGDRLGIGECSEYKKSSRLITSRLEDREGQDPDKEGQLESFKSENDGRLSPL